ncbi:GNAT family N-acetyltransferase [Winogradskyella wichelsiae]|uniref:GNAT family N-acetyltransferase n=1 Tax=Winogradskyella wichelsiae TaxID=2697007 RepID=UPI0015C7453C|nr:GNAT family N-acetyltransferase [Winogradskyella wichelsiae]
MKLIRTNSENKDFINLVKLLDFDLAERDGNEHTFFAKYNKIDDIKYVVIAYQKEKAIGCGAIKAFDKNTMEIKRMYTSFNHRGKGIASRILSELENWTTELYCDKCILETGIKQPEAIGLYLKNGYLLIPNYGQYIEIKNSKCFKKRL